MLDKQIEKLIKEEEKRQKDYIDLIPSENFVSQDVLDALGSVLVNKYSEGYPGARYYNGNSVVDKVENLCRERALKAFGLSPKEWSVNVQPLSGSPANVAVYFALVPLGEKIMGIELAHGGHLTHGHKVSITGKFWKQVPYGVSQDTEMLDYDELKAIAKKEQPKIVVAGYTAYPRAIDFAKFRKVADVAKAYLMVDMSHIAGLVVAGVHPSPFPYADIVTTTTHKTLRGPRSAIIFSRIDKRELPKKIDRAIFPGIQGGPHLNQIAAVAVTLHEAMQPSFKTYAKQIVKNTAALAEQLAALDWRVVSGGTDTHLVLVDTWLDGRGISGKEAANKLEAGGIVVNKNTIPFDTRSPADPSGIRIGMAAETTRGAKEKQAKEIAIKIDTILRTK